MNFCYVSTDIVQEILDTGRVPLPDGRQDGGDAVLVSRVHLGSLDRAWRDYKCASHQSNHVTIHLGTEKLDHLQLSIITSVVERKSSLDISIYIQTLNI